jgi:hypothetical protein
MQYYCLNKKIPPFLIHTQIKNVVGFPGTGTLSVSHTTVGYKQINHLQIQLLHCNVETCLLTI